MWVERVEALGFGPFNNAQLELGEGMTLVFGLNEAGKSSWHGALYAGLCGVRRGRGRRAAPDEEFERRHRPWDGGPWQAGCVVALANGSRFELTQDLATRSGTARDHATGREVTRDILTDQTPDASRWLGLDRDAFRAVACVPQTALLQILEQPAQLAGHLQRAAATAGTDATAAEAIRRIDDFLTEHVGTDRAFTKPLSKAKASLGKAEDDLRRAELAHAGMAQLREELRGASREKVAAEHELRCAEAADANRRADAAQDVWKQAADLAARYPEAPPAMGDDDALAQQARVAVDGYRNRPVVPGLDGPDAAALEAELAALPQPPAGDRKPAEEVETAYAAVGRARATVESLAVLEPNPLAAQSVPANASELRRLAAALAEPLTEAPPQHTSAGGSPSPAHQPRNRALSAIAAVAAVLLLVAGAALAVAARQPLGWVAAAVGVAVGAALVLNMFRDRTRRIAALEQQQATGTAWAQWKAAEQRITEARDQVSALGLPADPSAIRELADAADRARNAAQQRAEWEQRRNAANVTLAQCLSELAAALSMRGVAVTSDLEADVQRYRLECAERAQQAVQAARRGDLQAQLDNRRQAEGQAADAALRRSRAEQVVRTAATDHRIADAGTADLDALVTELESRLRERQHALDQRQQAAGDYAVLQKLLEGGRTPEDLRTEADRLAAAADRAAANLDPAQIAAADPGPDPVERLQALRVAAQDAGTRLTALEEREQERQRGVPSVAASQEAVAQAAERVKNLEHLGRILGVTREFLGQAQDNVHRSIAPQLADAIAPHLATVTGGRYTDVRVDPDDLQVRVRPPSGAWREAARLSHGTAEQVYLILRAALAQYLATTGEPCPLILDDPTAYADAARTKAVLDVLHSISADRQVVVFSHDPQVLAWAQQALSNPGDRVVELAGNLMA
ncbi:MAG: AAA family ATPase [Micromonosporaceae bacterium]